jgi:hypothetical protein
VTLEDQDGFAITTISSISFGRLPNETGGSPVPPLPANVNYAVKSSFLLSILEFVPEVSAKLKAARKKIRGHGEGHRSSRRVGVGVLKGGVCTTDFTDFTAGKKEFHIPYPCQSVSSVKSVVNEREHETAEV